MDIWWDQKAQVLWNHGLEREHPIVAPYRESLKRLRKAGIRAEIVAVSSQHGMNVQKSLCDLIDKM